ncbi:TPA: discoidin domain-containing protein [bacterium]|nr:discoidin domain-containing protein [bacterium]
MPGAYGVVSENFPLREAFARLWSPTLKYVMSATMGIMFCSFPDNKATPFIPLHPAIAGTIWALIIGVSIFCSAISFIQRLIKQKRISFEICDVFPVIAAITIILFCLNKRADSKSYRYLLPLLWSFPFLIEMIISTLKFRFIQYLGVILAVLFLAINSAGYFKTIKTWNNSSFPEKEAGIADLYPVITKLNELKINKCVASYGVSYRLTYQSDEEIICAQPINERFPNWPVVAYKEEVDSSTNVAYVLTDTVRFLKPSIFERHMRLMKTSCDKVEMPPFYLYHNFHLLPPADRQKEISLTVENISASHSEKDLSNLIDNSDNTIWTTGEPQNTNMWLRIDFKERIPLSAVQISYGKYFHDHAEKLSLWISTEDQWINLMPEIKPETDKFQFINGHPVYGNITTQTLWIDVPSLIHAIKLNIIKTNSGYNWTLAGIKIFVTEHNTIKTNEQ